MATTKTLIGDIEVSELTGEEAINALSAGLELAPPYKTERELQLERAGFTNQSPRSSLRADMRADLDG